MEKTYLEILADNDREAREGFSENAKDQLADNQDYEHDIDTIDNHPHELENQEEFKKFGGSHQYAAGPPLLQPVQDVSKQSVLHEKNIKTHVINIDSRFRDDETQIATEFLYKFQNPIKNVVSIRISSIEFPNTYYTFSKTRGNTSFTLYGIISIQNPILTPKIITIYDGNYDPMDMINALNTLITKAFPLAGITVGFNINSGLISFSSQTSTFAIDFEKGDYMTFVPSSFDRCLGYSLGFRVPNVLVRNGNGRTTSQYTPETFYNLANSLTEINPVSGSKCCYQALCMIDTIDNNYLFITLNPDWKVVINQAPDRTQHFSFCKLIMTAPKGGVLYDNGSNTITKEYWFQQPTNIVSFPVRVSDPYDQLINLNGMDFSFTLELKEVLNASLYETMRAN